MSTQTYLDLLQVGLFQEANRRFFHCIGLSLEIRVNSDTEEITFDIIDGRDDMEGFILKSVDEQQQKAFTAFQNERHSARIKGLGFIFQPSEGGRWI